MATRAGGPTTPRHPQAAALRIPGHSQMRPSLGTEDTHWPPRPATQMSCGAMRCGEFSRTHCQLDRPSQADGHDDNAKACSVHRPGDNAVWGATALSMS